MAEDELFTLIHGLQEKTVKLIGTIMMSSGLERVHMSRKSNLFVCFNVKFEEPTSPKLVRLPDPGAG